jgi:hypothetical protein
MRRTGDDNDPLLKEIEPIVHSIWAEGITRGIHRKTCLWMYIVALVLEPLGLLILIGKRIIPIILLVAIYFYFSDLVNKTHPHLSELLLSFGMFFVLLKDLEKMVIDACLNILVILSAGSILVWLGKGYERNAVFFNKFISSSYGKSLIATSIGALPMDYRRRCDHIMDLYLDSNDPLKAQELKNIIEENRVQ